MVGPAAQEREYCTGSLAGLLRKRMLLFIFSSCLSLCRLRIWERFLSFTLNDTHVRFANLVISTYQSA